MAYYAQQQYAPPPGNVIVVAAPTKQPDCLTRTCCCCCVNSSLARRFNNWPLLGKLCCLLPCCLLLVVVIVIVALLIYLNVGIYAASSNAQAQLAGVKANTISGLTYIIQDSNYVITPSNFSSSTTPAMVIVPEFKCDPVAYVPLAINIATNGYIVVIMSPKLHFPPFASSSINQFLDTYQTNFVIGGHGVGADTASAFVANTDSRSVRGLFMMAPFSGPQPPPNGIQTTIVYGDDDGWVSTDQIAKIRSNFPSNTNYTLITGANHAQFGSFASGFSGDSSPKVSADAQQQQTVAAAVSLLQSIK